MARGEERCRRRAVGASAFAGLLCLALVSLPGQTKNVTPGNGTIYVGTFAKSIYIIDEATEKPVSVIPLRTGVPQMLQLTHDGMRFYVLSTDLERFEIVDVRSRQSVDMFTLSTGNRRVRILAYQADSRHRFIVAVVQGVMKLADRFEIDPPMLVRYDLEQHKIVGTEIWSDDDEPQYFMTLRLSPDGKLLYAFSDEVSIFDTTTLRRVDRWELSRPFEPGQGRFGLGGTDDSADEPGHFSALFTMNDPVQHRELLGFGRVNLTQKTFTFFGLGPMLPELRGASLALAPDRARAYILQDQIGQYELWTVDLVKRRVEARTPFAGRPRMALRSSTNGKVLYIYEAGNTIDLYEAAGFRYLRTITLDADMTYEGFHVVPSGQ